MIRRSARFISAFAFFLASVSFLAAAEATTDSITFFVIGDPQINIPRWGTAGTGAEP